MSDPAVPVISIVIPTFNKWDYTFKCLMSLVEHGRDVRHEVIVVDNASSDETRQALPLLEGIRHRLNEENLGFAKASNQGAAMARAPYVLFLNNHTEASPGCLSAMVRALESSPDVAAAGAKLLYPDGTLQHAGVEVAYGAPLPIMPYHALCRQPADRSTEARDLEALTAACLLVRAVPGGGRLRRGLPERLRGRGPLLQAARARVAPALRARSGSRPPRVGLRRPLPQGPRERDPAAPALDGALLRLRRGPPQGPEPEAPTARPRSAVVPARDALRSIAPCLEDLALNLAPGDELVAAARPFLQPDTTAFARAAAVARVACHVVGRSSASTYSASALAPGV